jgi:hypothetical protein
MLMIWKRAENDDWLLYNGSGVLLARVGHSYRNPKTYSIAFSWAASLAIHGVEYKKAEHAKEEAVKLLQAFFAAEARALGKLLG